MRILVMVLTLVISTITALAQDPLIKIYLQDGSYRTIKLSEIETITLDKQDPSTELYVFSEGRLKDFYLLNAIEQMSFTSDNDELYIVFTTSGNDNSYKLSLIDSLIFTNPTMNKPFIVSLSKSAGAIGDKLSITGSGFRMSNDESILNIGNKPAIEIISWTYKEIEALIPRGASTGAVFVDIYGNKSNEVDLIIVPTIDDVIPDKARIGDIITIHGIGFGSEQGKGFISIGSYMAKDCISWDDSVVSLKVPSGAVTGEIFIVASDAESNIKSFGVIPQIKMIAPKPAKPGDVLTITGTGFGSSQANAYVFFNSEQSSEISSWTDNEIKVKVPQGVNSGVVYVKVNDLKSNEIDLALLNQILSIDPPAAKIGDTVTITGYGFKDSRGNSIISFNGAAATSYIGWNDELIKVVVPDGAQTGKVSITVGSQKSNEYDFSIIPRIKSVNPASSVIGNNIIIDGDGFGSSTTGSVVFSGATASQIVGWTSTKITVKVPTGAQTGKLYLNSISQRSNEVNFVIIPKINTLSTDAATIGSEISINGSGFGNVRGSGNVSFNSTIAIDIVYWSDSQIKVKVPNGASTGVVSVTASAVKSNELNFAVKPDLIYLNPNASIIGDEIYLDGTGFGLNRDNSIVSFNGANAIEYPFWTGTRIKVKVPRGAQTGAVSVTVGGNKSIERTFTVIPQIENINPSTATIGTEITITGTGFGLTQSTSIITFNTKNASSFTLWSDTLIKVRMPLGAETGKLSVTASNQKSNEKDFIVIPFISTVTPTSGKIGDEITITGNGFGSTEGLSFVTFNTANGTEYTRWSDTLIIVKVPIGASTGDLFVTASLQKSNVKTFTVIPHITNISPTSAKIGDNVTITGNGYGSLQGSGFVAFNGANATEIISWSDVQIVVRVPAGAQTGNMSVTQSSQKSNEFKFTIIPNISGISPNWGYEGDEITISGTGFGNNKDTSKVNFGTYPGTEYTSWSDTQIKVKVPSGVPAGTVKLSVTASGQKSNEYDFSVKPKLTSISPTSCIIGDTLILTGTKFGSSRGTNYVSVADSNVVDYVSWSDTQIKLRLKYNYNSGKVSVTVSSQKSNEIDYTLNKDEVRIGTQIWMEKNLDVSTYRNGDAISNITNDSLWSIATEGAWCYNNNDDNNNPIYGKLYNWYAVIDTRGLAPNGWHIATSNEWEILKNFVNGNGGKLKESGYNHWSTPNSGANNETGFTCLPAGVREPDGSFTSGVGYSQYTWTSTLFEYQGDNYNYGCVLYWDKTLITLPYGFNHHVGAAVRCVKDN